MFRAGWKASPDTLSDDEGRHEGETDEAVTLVPRERVQQLTTEQIGSVVGDDVKYSASATGTTVAKSVGDGETRLREFAKDSAATAVPVVVPTVARSVGDGKASLRNTGPRQTPKSLCPLVKLGLLELQSIVPRQSRNSQRVPMKLGLLGPEQMAIELPQQQPQSRLRRSASWTCEAECHDET